MDARDLRHAYAVLELTPPVDETSLKRQHKLLVRRWHPDQFQQDPAGQVDAAIALRNINVAYEAVLASLETPEPALVPPTSEGLPQDTTDRGFSLSHVQIDSIVDSLNRSNAIFSGRLSLHCWLSAIAAFSYLAMASVSHSRREDVFRLFGYLLLPLLLLWKYGAAEGPVGVILRILGWLFMMAPALVGLFFWLNS